MIKEILSKKTSTIVLTLIGLIVGVLLLASDFKYSMLYGIAIMGLSIFYLFTENIKSPIMFIGSLLIVSMISVNVLKDSPKALNTILAMVLFVYFGTLGLGYFFLKDELGQFVQSGASALLYLVLMNIFIKKFTFSFDKLNLYSIIVSVMFLIINTIVFLFRKKGD